ncbi:NigD-like protein [uncultured Bacteroides sp.]|uniref:NigD-like protein n=1 Tax=uncultured Bacteroides sp. TaxID=162156 RepID=UPI0025D5AD0A|nr:NigD-like protein [uncultured Bacteroides sp.]
MRKSKWLLGLLLLALMPMWQSCDDNDGYSIGDFSWDWATVRTTGGGGYYLEGDRWGMIDPVTSAIPWYRPVDGERVIAYFNPLYDMEGGKGVQVKMEGVYELLTKEVEDMKTEEEAKEFGNDPIVIYEGDMWLGGKFLNLIFLMEIPRTEIHRISLVQNKMESGEPVAPDAPETVEVAEDGYVHLELRYNTYGDRTEYRGWGRVSYNLEKFYPKEEDATTTMKGFKVTINSKDNGEGRVIVLDLDHPVGVPEKAKDVHTTSSIR